LQIYFISDGFSYKQEQVRFAAAYADNAKQRKFAGYAAGNV